MQSSWFSDDWAIYNRGPYMQVYKTNWYNDNQSGVHFETYIEARLVGVLLTSTYHKTGNSNKLLNSCKEVPIQ